MKNMYVSKNSVNGKKKKLQFEHKKNDEWEESAKEFTRMGMETQKGKD